MAKKKVHHSHAKRLKDNNMFLILLLGVCALAASYLLFTSNALKPNSTSDDSASIQNLQKIIGNSVSLQVNEQNNSGIFGNATLIEKDGKVTVRLDLKNEPKGAVEPAHIHVGSCIAPGAIQYPLQNVVNGVSETTLNVTFNDLKAAGPLFVNVHKSVSQMGSYVSCGNIVFN